MEFYDVSTPSGKIRLYVNRVLTWKWLPALLMVAAIAAMVAVVSIVSLPDDPTPPLQADGSIPDPNPDPWRGGNYLRASPFSGPLSAGPMTNNVPPWLPEFLDQFPWINKTVVDDLNNRVDPTWGWWKDPSVGYLQLKASGPGSGTGKGPKAKKPIPAWLPSFLDNFPWINKTVIDKLDAKVAAQTAEGGLLQAAPGGPKAVPAWLPDFLGNFDWINKTVIDDLRVRVVTPADEMEGKNTLMLKLAVEEVASESGKMVKAVPVWLPGFLNNFPWINQTVIDKLNDKVALQAPAPVLKSWAEPNTIPRMAGIPPWLPAFIDQFPWVNKSKVAELDNYVDPNYGSWKPAYNPYPWALQAAAPKAAPVIKQIPDWLPEFLDQFPWINKTKIDKINAVIEAQKIRDAAMAQNKLQLQASPDLKPWKPKKPVPAWLPDFLDSFPWINKTVIDKLNTKVMEEEDYDQALNVLKLQLAVNEVGDEKEADKGVPAWLPDFLSNFPWINQTVIDKLNTKVKPTSPVLMATGGKLTSGGKTVPPWLPGFLDQFPWINKTVISDLDNRVDPTWGQWPTYSPVLKAVPVPGVMGVPEWLPGFLDEFPYINKSVIYKIDALINAQKARDAAAANATPILQAAPGSTTPGKKPVPAWLPDFLNNFPWINKTVIDKLDSQKELSDEEQSSQIYNMLSLKMALTAVGDESTSVKAIPPWLPGFLDNFITNKTVIQILNDKVANQSAQAGLMLKAGEPGSAPVPNALPISPAKPAKQVGDFQFWGDGSTFDKLNSPWINKTDVKNVQIHNFHIDAISFSELLKELPNLQTISIEASSLTGQFTPATLPQVQSVKLSVPASSLSIATARTTMMLSNLLFIRKTAVAGPPTPGSDPMAAKLPNLADLPTTTIEIDGVKILAVDHELKTLTVNVEDCQTYLQGQDLTGFTKLGIFNCPLTAPLTIPSTVNHLNLHNAFPQDQAVFDQQTANFKGSQLTELILYDPPIVTLENRQLLLNVADVPAVTKLSLSNVGLKGTGSLPSVTDLTLERPNVTAVVANLGAMFPNAKTVTLFDVGNIPDDNQYKVLNQFMQMRPAALQVTEMKRTGGTDPDAVAVEGALTALRVMPTATEFVVSYSGAATQFSQPFVPYVKNMRRFNALSFGDFDTFAAYTKYDNAGSSLVPSAMAAMISLAVALIRV